MTKETFRHRVTSWTDADGEVHLMQEQFDPLVEKWQTVSHHAASLNDEAFRQELRVNGWIEPEKASQVLECLESLEKTAGVSMPEDDPARMWARYVLSEVRDTDAEVEA